ncbi:phage head morphogenesis protein [Serratia bockelmannii]|uniref:phage head morphogenesis protein n=1 Tax=Serratia bockelmannii TaxID=2703793 RepID=UPI003FA71972
MAEPSLGFALTQAPAQAIAYFRSKGLTPSLNWLDVADEVHACQFTVAGIMKLDVLNDIHQALGTSLAAGGTLRQFQDVLAPTLQRKGWLGRGLKADEHGELEGKKLMPYRLDTIFRTNLQSAYAAGRYQQQMRNVDDRPYWQYCAVMDSRTRPAHAILNGRIFRYDDPIWQVIYPPNGYRCRCWVRALNQAQVDAHPVGVESSAGRLVIVQQPYGTQGEMRPVTAYRDPVSGRVLTPDAGFHLNPGRGYLAGLGQSLLDKAATAPPRLAAMAVRETLGNNRLVSEMNRDMAHWTQQITPASALDSRRVGALSPGALARLSDGGALPSPVITLTSDVVLAYRHAGAALWPRLASALRYPAAVVRQSSGVTVVSGSAGRYDAITLAASEQGYQVVDVAPYVAQALQPGVLLDGQLPEDADGA